MVLVTDRVHDFYFRDDCRTRLSYLSVWNLYNDQVKVLRRYFVYSVISFTMFKDLKDHGYSQSKCDIKESHVAIKQIFVVTCMKGNFCLK